MEIEELVSSSTVVRFDMGVLDRFARIDEVQLDVAFGSPAQHRMAGQFCAVVKAQRLRSTADERNSFEDADRLRQCVLYTSMLNAR